MDVESTRRFTFIVTASLAVIIPAMMCYQYAGCYRPEYAYDNSLTSPDMTLERCAQLCEQYFGYTAYLGMYQGYKCHCILEEFGVINSTDLVSESYCDADCTDMEGMKCGGVDSFSVWLVHESPRYDDAEAGYESYEMLSNSADKSLANRTDTVDCMGTLLKTLLDARSKCYCQSECMNEARCTCYAWKGGRVTKKCKLYGQY